MKMNLEFEILASGYCWNKESVAIRKGRNVQVKFAATYALIKHPVKGWVMFDTGYASRIHEIASKWPEKLFTLITPIVIEEKEDAVKQLEERGIKANDIKHIIVSHFHSDHIGGLLDFPEATFYCLEKAYLHVKDRFGFSGVKVGFLKQLLPEDIENRLVFVDATHSGEDADLGKRYDLFEDGSIHLYELSGHATGMLAARFNTKTEQVLLASDACWKSDSFRYNILPAPIAKVFFDSWKEFKTSLEKLHFFHKKHPEISILPCHCQEVFEERVQQDTEQSGKKESQKTII